MTPNTGLSAALLAAATIALAQPAAAATVNGDDPASAERSSALLPGAAFQDYGKVTEVIPIVRREKVIEPVETCRLERVRGDRQRIVHPVTVRGGKLRIEPPHRVLGSLFRRQPSSAPRDGGALEEVCHSVERARYVDEVTGYRVRYRYGGERFTKITTEDPGDRIPIEVRVEPRL
jgi:hypothetical protein